MRNNSATTETSNSWNESGVKISKLLRVISFRQEKWLKPYIDFNTETRKQAKNAFEKSYQTDEQRSIREDNGKCQEPNGAEADDAERESDQIVLPLELQGQ